MRSAFSKFIVIAIFLILLAITSAQTEDSTQDDQVVTTTIESVQSANILNCRSDSFQSKLYLIKLSQLDSWILLIGSSIALLIQFSFFILSIKVPRLRSQPGDILLGAFCAEFILSIHWFTMSLEALLYPDTLIYQDEAFCVINSIISIIGSSLQGLYNFFFFLFIGFSIKNSLRVSSISRKKTHIFAIGISLLFLGTIFLMKLNGKTLYGTCSFVSDESFPMASILLYLVFLFFAITILIYFNQKIPDTTFYKKKRQEFLSFSRLYLTFCLLMWGIIAISNTSLFLNCQYFHLEELIHFQTVGNAAKVISSIILPIIRIKDPYLRSIIRQEKKKLKKKIAQTIPLLHTESKIEEKDINEIANSVSSNNSNLQLRQQSKGSILRGYKSKSQNQSYDLDGSQLKSIHSSTQKDQIQRLSQKYKNQRNKMSSFDELKLTATTSIVFQNIKGDQNDQLSQSEIDARLSIFDNIPNENDKSEINQKGRKSNITCYLPPIFSIPSNISTSTRKQSSPYLKSESVNQESCKSFQMQFNKVELENFESPKPTSLLKNTIYSKLGKLQKSKIEDEYCSLDQDQSFSLSKKETYSSQSSFKFNNQHPTINVIKVQETPNQIEHQNSPNSNMASLHSPNFIPVNIKLIESSNNIRQRKKLSCYYKSSSFKKEGAHETILSYLDVSRDNSKVFLSKRHEFRKTLNQEITKKRLHTKLYEYLKKNSLSSEVFNSMSYDAQTQNNQSQEDAILKEKLNELMMNAHMMDYFNDPYYRDGSQSESGSFTDIDAIFGHESLSSGSSSLYQNPQLQAETIEGSKEHFIRILQRNIKMGVLCRILCGIQIHFMRKKRFCSKVDIFQDTYSSIFDCKINSVKLNKNSSPINSQKSSVVQTRTGFYEQFQTLPEINKAGILTYNKKEMVVETINQCDTSQQSVDALDGNSSQIIHFQKIQEMKEQNNANNVQRKQSENLFNKSRILQLRESSRQKSNTGNQQINLRQISLSLQNRQTANKTKKQKQDENEIFYEVKIFQFSDDSIKSNLHHAPAQLLDSDTFDLVRMRVYAPTIFHSLQQSEVEMIQNQDEQDPYKPKAVIDIEKSFNIQHNMAQIKNASGSDGGKSGQFFFFSHDNKFLLKTINERELKILLERLPSYFRYLKSNQRSLIAKIFGVYTFEGLNENPIHLVLMKNIAACTKQFIERTYDLKGSTFDREVLPKTKKESESFSRSLNRMILKDLDFINLEKKIYISLEDRHRIFAQLKKDAEFLRSCGWIDYSLIVFKINKKRHTEWKESNQIAYLEEEEDLDSQVSNYFQIESSEQRGIFYHIGIIDYLQLYDMQKRLEKWAKRIIHFSPQLDTSSQDPDTYSKRFINYMKQIFDV